MPDPVIYTIVTDAHNVHCLGEDDLDVWWASQTPEQKAEIFETFMDGDEDLYDSAEEPDAHL